MPSAGGWHAATRGNLGMVKTLCEVGANPLAESQVCTHRLACACMAGDGSSTLPCKRMPCSCLHGPQQIGLRVAVRRRR